MANRAEVMAEMELLGIGNDERVKPQPSRIHSGKNGTPESMEEAIAAQRVSIDEISRMVDRMGAQVQEIRETVRAADDALAKLEASLSSLTTEEE